MSRRAKESFLARHGISNIGSMTKGDFMDGVHSMIQSDNAKAYRILYTTHNLFDLRLRRDKRRGVATEKLERATNMLKEGATLALKTHCARKKK